MFCSVIIAEGKSVKFTDSRIVKADIFKNNIVLLKRELIIPAHKKVLYIKSEISPVHGTFWTASIKNIVFDFIEEKKTEIIEIPSRVNIYSVLNSLKGKKVSLYFNKDDVLTGTIASNVNQPYGYIIIDSENGREIIQTSRIWRFNFKEKKFDINMKQSSRKVEKKIKYIRISIPPSSKKRTLNFEYLASGIIWAPSYRLDITGKDKGYIRMKAVIKNELDDLKETELSLISGYPSIYFSGTVSPINNRISSYLSQLNRRKSSYNSRQSDLRHSTVSVIISTRSFEDASLKEGFNSRNDLYFFRVGKQSVTKGDSRVISLGSAPVRFKRVVKWHINSSRNERGKLTSYGRRTANRSMESNAWDFITFKNPFKFPLTTAPFSVYENGNIGSQNICYWTPSGSETEILLTKALNISTYHHEREVKNSRRRIVIDSDDFRETIIEGEINIHNLRTVKERILITREFYGKLIDSDGTPKKELLPEGAGSLNEKSQLVWDIIIEPGSKINLKYRYKILTDI